MKKDDRLFEIFTSEFVIVMINKDAEDVVQTEESITSSKHPIQFAGFHVNVYKYLDSGMLYINKPTKLIFGSATSKNNTAYNIAYLPGLCYIFTGIKAKAYCNR